MLVKVIDWKWHFSCISSVVLMNILEDYSNIRMPTAHRNYFKNDFQEFTVGCLLSGKRENWVRIENCCEMQFSNSFELKLKAFEEFCFKNKHTLLTFIINLRSKNKKKNYRISLCLIVSINKTGFLAVMTFNNDDDWNKIFFQLIFFSCKHPSWKWN